MKNYLTTTCLALLFLFSATSLFAQTFTVAGQVLISDGTELYPIPGIDITVSSEDGTYEAFVFTDDEGQFNVSFDIEEEEEILFLVSTIDWCTGEFLQQSVSNDTTEAFVSFVLCGNIVFPDCTASFGFSEGEDLTVNFVDYSFPSDEITAWAWDFGDGNTSTEQHPTHTYAEDGEYIVTLNIATDTCESSIEQHVWLGNGGWNPDCFVWFWYNFPTDDLLTVQFEALVEGEITDITWDFGDGNSSTELMPTHTYAQEGIYEVSVAATFFNGIDTCSTSYTEHICLDWGGWDECDAWFYNFYIDDENNTVAFFNSAWAASEIIGYNWDFGDGNTSTEANPVHDYAENGVYEVILSILSADSCSATSTMFVYIDEETHWQGSCLASFYFYNQEPGSTEIFFENTSWAIGNIVSWAWDFGDGATSNEENPVHNYVELGEYEVTLTITTADGCESSATYFVWVDDWVWESCQADFWYDVIENEDGTYSVQFQDFSWETPVAWTWNFGDGATSSEQNPTHTYTSEGFFSVTLEILTADGCTSIIEHPVILDDGIWSEPECQAMFWFELDEDDPMTLNFMDMSIGDELSAWTWNFGDGNSSSEQNPTHSYAEGGAYLVTLSIESGDCSQSFSMLVWTDENIFYNDSCQALFLPIIQDNYVLLLDISIGGVVEWSWDLGDGTTSNEPFVEHFYEEEGTYTISLTIVTAEGCTSTFEVVYDSELGDFHGDTNPSALLASSTKDAETTITSLNLYPNPVQDKLNLAVSVTEKTDYQIQIINTMGQVVHQQAYTATTGEQSVVLNIAHLATGAYHLTLQCKNHLKSHKFMKIK